LRRKNSTRTTTTTTTTTTSMLSSLCELPTTTHSDILIDALEVFDDEEEAM
jgi:hypothetical protein